MARDGVPVGPELAGLVARHVEGERFDVRAACLRVGVSTTTFYKYAARYRAGGVAGFFPDSRRPGSSPGRIEPLWEEQIVRGRKELIDAGWDGGADQIRFWLHDQHDPDRIQGDALPGLPSRATINRVLARRGQLLSVPQRRPRRADRRFEAAHPNGRWQMDGFAYRLADRSPVVVLHVIDDCSRLEIALRAVRSENAADVWETLHQAAASYGLPAELLTDNGTAFSGRRRGWVSPLEANLRALGVRQVTSSIRHPQTCGKVERAHQPVQQWLNTNGPYRSVEALQQALDTYRHRFNHQRRKTHLDGLTPAQRYALGPTDGPADPADHLVASLIVKPIKTCCHGNFTIDRISLGLGATHARKTLTMFRQNNTIVLFDHNNLVVEFELDHRKRYQPIPTKRHDVSAKS